MYQLFDNVEIVPLRHLRVATRFPGCVASMKAFIIAHGLKKSGYSVKKFLQLHEQVYAYKQ